MSQTRGPGRPRRKGPRRKSTRQPKKVGRKSKRGARPGSFGAKAGGIKRTTLMQNLKKQGIGEIDVSSMTVSIDLPEPVKEHKRVFSPRNRRFYKLKHFLFLHTKKYESECLAQMKYDPNTLILTLTFVYACEVYDYFDVSKEEWNKLEAAISKGKYFNKYIRNNYSFKRR